METKTVPSQNVLLGGLLVVLAMLIFGSYGLLVRFIKTDAILLVWALQVVGVIGFLILALRNRTLFDHKNMIRKIFLMTVCVTIADLTFFMALRATTVSTAVFVKFLMPIFVVIFTFRTSTVSIKKLLLLIGLGTTGLFFILSSQGGISLIGNTGVLWALVTAITLAFFIIIFKEVANTVPLTTILFYRYATASLILIPFIASVGGVIGQISGSWLELLGFGFLYAVVGTLIHMQGLKLTKVQYGAILGYVEPFAATIMSIAFLGEALTIPLVVGGLMILSGSALALK